MKNKENPLTRRRFIQKSAISATGIALGSGLPGCSETRHTLPRLIPLSDRPKLDSSKKPNIIFIFSDQHRADVMGCTENKVIQTPNLDKLAAAGTNFRNTYCAAPQCVPSRTSILTGLYPHQSGVTLNVRDDPDPKLPTMPRQLQKAGYKTAIIGKTHYWNIKNARPSFSPLKWGFDVREKEAYVRYFGFDDVFEIFDLYVPAFKKFTMNIHTHYTDYLRKRGKFDAFQEQINQIWTGSSTQWDGLTSVLSQEEDQTSFLTRKASEWIKQQDKDHPFFLNLGYIAPHPPFVSDPIWANYYKDKTIQPGSREAPKRPDNIWGEYLKRRHKKSLSHLLTEEYVQNTARHYYGRISLIDQGIGEIIRTVEEQGIADNTWILYNSDHGDMMGDHNLMKKAMFYKGSVQVPNIIRPPKGMPSKTVDSPIEGIDITATILDIAGAEPIRKSSGQSLLPIMKGEGPKKDTAFSAIGPTMGEKTRHFVSAHTQRYRLTCETTTKTPCELFDLQEDPDELYNRVNDPAFTMRVQQMIDGLILPHMGS